MTCRVHGKNLKADGECAFCDRERLRAEVGKLETELAEAVKGIGELEAEVEMLKAEAGYHDAKDVIANLEAEVEGLRTELAGSQDALKDAQKWQVLLYDGMVRALKLRREEGELASEFLDRLIRKAGEAQALADELGEAGDDVLAWVNPAEGTKALKAYRKLEKVVNKWRAGRGE